MLMRVDRHCRRTALLAAVVAGLLNVPGIAAAQTKIYPEGTDCANQATIAERLLCGRQEFRRQHGLAVVQPTIVPPGTVEEPEPILPGPTPPIELRRPSAQQERLQPNTASPRH
jgi:hypothetical protein